MAACTGYDTYRSNHFEGMEPKRLILMLYEGGLRYLRLAREGVLEKDVKKRGENLSKVIAIVSELNACLDTRIEDEFVSFLQGLYAAILTELPKVSLQNDTRILDRTGAYLSRLKEMWEKEVMGTASKTEQKGNGKPDEPLKVRQSQTGTPVSNPTHGGYNAYTGKGTCITV